VAVFAVVALSLDSRTPAPQPPQETRQVEGGLVVVVPPPLAAVPGSDLERGMRSWWQERAELVRDWLLVPPGAKGMTWGKRYRDERLGIDMVGCWDGNGIGCDAYKGDTPCGTKLPLLCVKVDERPRPPYRVRYPSRDNESYYGGWLGGEMAVTPAVEGRRLGSRSRADGICHEAFGEGWRLAEHHDGRYHAGMDSLREFGGEWNHRSGGRGGWNFYGEGSVPSSGRFWVAIDDQDGNCWDSW
jgi:hypothetical protein